MDIGKRCCNVAPQQQGLLNYAVYAIQKDSSITKLGAYVSGENGIDLEFISFKTDTELAELGFGLRENYFLNQLLFLVPVIHINDKGNPPELPFEIKMKNSNRSIGCLADFK